MNLWELNKKLKLARQRGFRFLHINELTIKIYSHQRYINIRCYLKHRIAMCQRLYFRRISENKEYVENFCNDRNNPFHFACQKWIKNCTEFYNFNFISLAVTPLPQCHNRNGFYKLKNFSLSPGIEPESSSPESLSYTTRPPSHK